MIHRDHLPQLDFVDLRARPGSPPRIRNPAVTFRSQARSRLVERGLGPGRLRAVDLAPVQMRRIGAGPASL